MPAPATRSVYRLLLMKGLTPPEAASLTAFLCGLPTTDLHWSLEQVNQLLFLRRMRADRPLRRRRWRRQAPALIPANPPIVTAILLPPSRSTTEAAPSLLPAPLRHVRAPCTALGD